jgi:hypothetical protein
VKLTLTRTLIKNIGKSVNKKIGSISTGTCFKVKQFCGSVSVPAREAVLGGLMSFPSKIFLPFTLQLYFHIMGLKHG